MASEIWRYLRSNREMATLAIAAFVSLLTNIISSLLESKFSFVSIVVSIVIILIVLKIVSDRLYKSERKDILPKEQRPPRHAGLIVNLSPRRESEERQVHEIAIEHHLDDRNKGNPLQVCWLITSQGIGGTEAEAMNMKEKYGERCDVRIRKINAFDITDVYKKVNEIYTEAEEDPNTPLKPEQIIVDFTGGTTPMSSGLALACSSVSPMQYIYGGRLSDTISRPMLIDLRTTEG